MECTVTYTGKRGHEIESDRMDEIDAIDLCAWMRDHGHPDAIVLHYYL